MVHKRLSAFRKGHDLTMAQAAKILGVNFGTYRGWEAGRLPGAALGPLDRLLTLLERRPELWAVLTDTAT